MAITIVSRNISIGRPSLGKELLPDCGTIGPVDPNAPSCRNARITKVITTGGGGNVNNCNIGPGTGVLPVSIFSEK